MFLTGGSGFTQAPQNQNMRMSMARVQRGPAKAGLRQHQGAEARPSGLKPGPLGNSLQKKPPELDGQARGALLVTIPGLAPGAEWKSLGDTS